MSGSFKDTQAFWGWIFNKFWEGIEWIWRKING